TVEATTLPGGHGAGAGDSARRVVIAGRSYLARSMPIADVHELTALASTSAGDEALASLRTTAWIVALAALAVAVALALLWSRQLSRPVERLAAFSEKIARGDWDEPLEMKSAGELRTLVDALEKMRGELRGYRERLRTGERQAAYGQI